MDYSHHNNLEIPLDLIDRRGHRVRALAVRDLRITVWTQNPGMYMLFFSRDVKALHDRDVLPIPECEISGMPPGVIQYRYTFRDMGHDEVTRTVTTGIYWEGVFTRPLPSNNVNFETIAHLKDDIEALQKNLTAKISELRTFISENYTDKLNDEIDRAMKVESELKRMIDILGKELRKEKKRSANIDAMLIEQLNTLTGDVKILTKNFGEAGKTQNEAMKNLSDGIYERIKELTRRMDLMERIYNRRLDDVRSVMRKTRDQISANKSAIAVINGDADTPGSIKHAVAHCKHYTDDKTHKLKDKGQKALKKAMDSIQPVPKSTIRGWFDQD